MAPARKYRGVNKRYSSLNDHSPSKDVENSKTIVQRKRKLSDMLGSQWSKEELERFYEAYRKFGKDWKKVAAAVRNRSVEMVEALYLMNRAYLSLPEGTASVVGLIAMMTDHYCNLMGSDSEQESNDGGMASRKSQKRGRGKVRSSYSKGSAGRQLLPSQTVASSPDCLSMLKKKRSGGSRPRAVGKRTPRFPVSFSHEKITTGRFSLLARQGIRPKADANDDYVEHEVALALAEASQRGGSPQLSQTPNVRTGSMMSSPIWSGERMGTELELTSAKHSSDMDDDGFEGSLGSMVGDKGAVTAVRKGRRIHGKKSEVDYGVSSHFNDTKEACSETEGQNFGVTLGRVARHITRKKSKKALFSGDEGTAFDALQTLADLSLMMPETENESSVHVKEEEDNLTGNNELHETVHATYQRGRTKSSGVAKTSKLGKVSAFDVSGILEPNEEPQQPTSRLARKKQKMLTSKMPRTEVNTETPLSEETEIKDAVKQPASKSKRPSSVDLRREKDESTLSVTQLPVANHVDLPNKVRSRRKTELQKPQNCKDLNKFINAYNPDLSNSSVHDGAVNVKVMLSNYLLNYQVRRWCACEWFYSAIDYPWFAKREFVEYLNHVGLGHVPRLTHVEWGVIRSSLGKPRRFSEQFLKEEKEKLNQYRDSVRKHYTELREGTREGLPTDLARPLSVGQRVMSIHPKTREIHDGNVLTVDHDRCRVQFDRPELGVEFVRDIDCMPSNPLENMPASLARNTVTMDKLFSSFSELKMNGRAKDQKLAGSLKISSGEMFDHVDVPSHISPALSNLLKQAKEIPTNYNLQAKTGTSEAANGHQVVNSAVLAQMQAKEADVQALAELTRALEKKEAVVSELKHLNDDVFENQRVGDNALKESESFKKQYAAVLVQLNTVNDQVSHALQDLRKRNTYHSSPSAWPKATATAGDSGGPLNSSDQQATHVEEAGSHVHEIVESSRRKAQTMVDAAVQAMSSLKVGENCIDRIEEAIDYISNRLSLDDTKSFSPVNSIHGSLTLSCGPQLELKSVLGTNGGQISSELISHCVATLFMIQKCTERQFPPADVAQILDSAVVSLQPCCSQNLPVYAEIQKCMGIIRNQILALIPT